MPPKKSKVGRIGQLLRQFRTKPRKEEDNADIIDFYEEEVNNELTNNEPINKLGEQPVKESVNESKDEVIEVNEKITTEADHKEYLRVSQLEALLRAEQKKADQIKKEYAAKPKMKATDIAALIKESIAVTIKEQLESELSKRDKAKLERQQQKELLRQQKEAELEAKRAELEAKRAELEAKKEADRLIAKEKRAKEREQQTKLELERMRAELQQGIQSRESALKTALGIQISRARSSVLLS